MSIAPGDSVTVDFATSDPSTGALTSATGTPVGVLVRNGTDSAETVTVTLKATGRYKAAFTVPAGWSAGDEVDLMVTATVAAVAGGDVVWRATLEATADSDADAIAAAVWGAAQSDYDDTGTFGALIYVVSIAGSGDISTLDTAASSYITAAEFLKRYDYRTIARYCSDTDTAITLAALPTNVNLLALLNDASGILEMAVLRGARYTASQIANLTGVAKAARDRIIADVAICLVYERRPDIFDHREPVCYTRAMSLIDALAEGKTIFGYATVTAASLVDLQVDTREIIDSVRKTTASELRSFFGDRVNRRE
jgi:hypothetical protein